MEHTRVTTPTEIDAGALRAELRALLNKRSITTPVWRDAWSKAGASDGVIQNMKADVLKRLVPIVREIKETRK